MKKDKTVIFENREVGETGTFSVGGAPNTRYDKEVTICVARDGIEMTARFFLSKHSAPKTCEALDGLAKAMLEDGADEVDVVLVG